MLEVAYGIIGASKTPLAFAALYDGVAKELEMTQEEKDDRIGNCISLWYYNIDRYHS